MNKSETTKGIFLLIGITFITCLFLIFGPKGGIVIIKHRQDTIEKKCSSEDINIQKYHMEVQDSVRMELDSINNYYQTVEKLEHMPKEVFVKYWAELKDRHSDITYIKCNALFQLLYLGWIE